MEKLIDYKTPNTITSSDISELELFEELAQQASRLGFTVILTHYRYHPVHTMQYPDVCQSCVCLSIVPILEEAKLRFGRLRDVYGQSIRSVVIDGFRLLSQNESRKGAPKGFGPRVSPEERERRAERMRARWRQKRAEAARPGMATDELDGAE